MPLFTMLLACRPSFPVPEGAHVVTRHEIVTEQGRLGWLLAPSVESEPGRARWDVDRELTREALGIGWPLAGFVDRRIEVHDSADVDSNALTRRAVVLLPGAVNVPHQATGVGLELASHGHAVLLLDLGFGAEALDLPTDVTEAAARETFDVLERDALEAHVERGRQALAWFAEPGFGLPVQDGPWVVGHSHGGAVALELCRTSSRCSGVVNLDGPAYAKVREEGVLVPWVHVASRDPALLDEASLDALGWASFYPQVKATELGWVDEARRRSPSACSAFMKRSGHLDFTDFPFLVPGHRSDLSAQTAHERTVRAVLAARDHFDPASNCTRFDASLGEGFTAR